jgi:tellurite resistance protein TehA-like permease
MDAVPLVVAAMLSTTLGFSRHHGRVDTTSVVDRLACWGCFLVAILAMLASMAGD